MPPRARASRTRLTPIDPDKAPCPAVCPVAAPCKKTTPLPRALSVDALEQFGASTPAEWLMASITLRAAASPHSVH